jgi:hypothetical protein
MQSLLKQAKNQSRRDLATRSPRLQSPGGGRRKPMLSSTEIGQVGQMSPQMARIAVTPEWVGMIDFETRFPSFSRK